MINKFLNLKDLGFKDSSKSIGKPQSDNPSSLRTNILKSLAKNK